MSTILEGMFGRKQLSAYLALAALGSPSVARAQQADPTAPEAKAPVQAPAQAAPPSDPAANGAGALEGRMKALEDELAALKASSSEKPSEKPKEKSWTDRVKIGGYIQPQLLIQAVNEAASPNLVDGKLPAGIGANSVVAKADGTTTNPSYFRIRRARLKVAMMPTDYARVIVEIEPFSSGGPQPGTGVIYRQLEAQGLVKGPGFDVEIGAGAFKVPLSYEILQSDADRDFIERSWGERQMTPGEYDVGAHATLSAFEKHLRADVAVVNGITIGEKTFAVLPDLNRSKDVVGYANYNFGPVDVGAGGYAGRGQTVDATGLRFKTFPRWAANVEAGFHAKLMSLGETRLLGEATLARNMDRSVLPAIPTDLTQDVDGLDQIRAFVRLEQDLTEWAAAGVRYDTYSPDSAQSMNTRDAVSLVGVLKFTKGLKLMLEYDDATDNTHKRNGQPPSKHSQVFSSVLQAKF